MKATFFHDFKASDVGGYEAIEIEQNPLDSDSAMAEKVITKVIESMGAYAVRGLQVVGVVKVEVDNRLSPQWSAMFRHVALKIPL